MLRVVIILVGMALTIFAAVDCLQTTESQLRYLPKIAWLVVVIVIPWVGPIAWLLAGRERSLPPRGRPATGPRGPEDDPDFLRNL
ncbi:PLD nuclease N-terminal domain-containing protein [Lapillicoccus sp.]|uniref:PLD nuclease N-terminal domain-containing protein n=1 Tax=Lapillicoccus sp. TaxID=1909287 RepID=UPI0027BC5383|nr:PLD nuclease N-terminal domain-containing protein [Actinomycetota bacterium]